MQQKAVYLLFCKFTLHVSGVNRTHHQGIHKTVTTASSADHIFVQPPPSNVAKLAWPRWMEVAAQKYEAVVTVLYTPDDGCI